MTSSVGMPWLDPDFDNTPQPAAKMASTADDDIKGFYTSRGEYWSTEDTDEFIEQETGGTDMQNQGSGYQFIPGVSRLPTPGEVSTGIQVASAGIDAYNKIKSGQTSSTAAGSPGGMKAIDGTYSYRPYRKRRRRRRLLTAQDKADIAFLHGQLGSGQLGRAAISALLSRRVA